MSAIQGSSRYPSKPSVESSESCQPRLCFLLLHTPRHERLINLAIREVFTNIFVITEIKQGSTVKKKKVQSKSIVCIFQFVITGCELFSFPLTFLIEN